MFTEEWDDVPENRASPALPVIRGLRPVSLQPVSEQLRRRCPRRQIVGSFVVERRHADRRRAIPGIDGLLRMVLADEWQ